MVVYIDDILLLAESREEMASHVLGLVFLLRCLGFVVNSEKSVLFPTQKIEILGFSIDSISMGLTLPYKKVKKILAESRSLVSSENLVSSRALSRLLVSSMQRPVQCSQHHCFTTPSNGILSTPWRGTIKITTPLLRYQSWPEST